MIDSNFNIDDFRRKEGDNSEDDDFEVGEEVDITLTDKEVEEIKKCECKGGTEPYQCPMDSKKKKDK